MIKGSGWNCCYFIIKSQFADTILTICITLKVCTPAVIGPQLRWKTRFCEVENLVGGTFIFAERIVGVRTLRFVTIVIFAATIVVAVVIIGTIVSTGTTVAIIATITLVTNITVVIIVTIVESGITSSKEQTKHCQ